MELFGINGSELLVLALIAVVVLGPEKLPSYAQKLAGFIKSLRGMAENARTRLREEGGEELADLDWKKLDPRQYDPRKIIRDALLDDDPAPAAGSAAGSSAGSAGKATGGAGAAAGTAMGTAAAAGATQRTIVAQEVPTAEGEPAPFDDEAT